MFVLRLLARLLMGWVLMTAALGSAAAPAAPLNAIAIEDAGARPTIRFTDLDISFAADPGPDTRWQRVAAMPFWSAKELGSRNGAVSAFWARARFDRAALGQAPLAILTEGNREQFTVYVNGQEIFRNFAMISDNIMGWNRAYLIPVPRAALRPGTNEIRLAINSNFDLGAGSIRLGPQDQLQEQHFWLNFWRTTAPIAANFAMLFLSIAALFLWLARHDEHEHLFLALSGFMWFARNYDFYAPRMPIDPQLFANLTLYASYFAAAASLSFCLVWMRVNYRFLAIAAAFGLGALFAGFHALELIPTVAIYVVTLAMGVAICVMLFQAVRNKGYQKHWPLFLVCTVCMIANFHDLGRTVGTRWWDGLGFYTQPFDGLLMCLTVLIAFGRQSLAAFSSLENVNQDLEKRVATVQAELAASEEERRNLEVAAALERERERLMSEVHDGIGSSLVTALAVAKREGHPKPTVDLLSRAVSDLKITVDSLDPMNGDLLALLGSLRHRLEPGLTKAGLTVKWDVRAVPLLPWLDSTNALHLLRLVQEAASNALAHSGGNLLTFHCGPANHQGVAGVNIIIADNGSGFDPAPVIGSGRGLANMQARAAALTGVLDWDIAPGAGTKIKLWLPELRAGG
jgi:signal transduction histidine kinase